ncbi:signal peptidase I, bacterial type [Clostridium pasteurianum DSM 525 = ATCC 6013]|uniref:Signal peptidase I n=1 Tax=Clostridium pasteurianum DSM 525 = ATCC 6013 TaxID=1262449 RepID=A0A0H3IYW1_CLOPA|nr:signal peptidase I [Clostridium pasteurianum]AJA46204.1 signal peptidase I, bacterial type [Clostridium pasteurianum DSM 525 = ATCC 6013]AJA50192.1 signal peptidase I, bacterial type [Clostridium pasteurianum DSM 525 = ATCC 6013]AOZ73660.1 signal peptidase I [Clostridium pasteurianum DSM 525 = ATCC 6013]AOZ77457.1 signal peptidase I [Clostridium pasteurianum]ELP57463.1 signal peptidase [Clostridium pasteurianum DSM 525 = ATCC 6013]
MEIVNYSKILKTFVQLLFIFILAILFAIGINKYIFARADIEGTSMLSTLNDKDITFVEKISSITHIVKRNEIIIFNSRNENNDLFIKRVIGIAGDKVQIKNGKVYINGNSISEPYLNNNTITEPGPFIGNSVYTVPKGYIFVLGDNRGNSTDSRFFGPVNIKDIKGHAIIRVYPLNKIRLL